MKATSINHVCQDSEWKMLWDHRIQNLRLTAAFGSEWHRHDREPICILLYHEHPWLRRLLTETSRSTEHSLSEQSRTNAKPVRTENTRRHAVSINTTTCRERPLQKHTADCGHALHYGKTAVEYGKRHSRHSREFSTHAYWLSNHQSKPGRDQWGKQTYSGLAQA